MHLWSNFLTANSGTHSSYLRADGGGSEARGGDFLADGLDRLHDLARGLLAGERQAALIHSHPAFVDAGELGELADVQVIKVTQTRGRTE